MLLINIKGHMDKREKFKNWYVGFLLGSGNVSKGQAMAEAERVADMVDCAAITDVAESDCCQLCANDEKPNAAECYGLTDLGNSEPQKRNEKLAGQKSGTVLPLTVPVCKKCKRNIVSVQIIPTLISMIIVVATLISVNITNVKQKLFASNLFVPANMRPFFVFAVITSLSILLSAVLRRIMIAKLSKKTKFNVLDIKALGSLREKGWFRLYGNKHFSQILFSDTVADYMCEDLENSEDECDQEQADDGRHENAPEHTEE